MNKSTIIRTSIALGIFVASFGVTYITKMAIKGESNASVTSGHTVTHEVSMEEPVAPNSDVAVVEDSTKVTQGNPVEVIMPRLNVSVSEYTPDYSSLTYSFTVTLKDFPEKATADFCLFDIATNDTVVKNQDGKFTRVKPVATEQYRLMITWRDSVGYEGLAFDTIISGFKQIEKPKVKKMEASELERYINSCNRKLTQRNSQISPNVSLNFTNLNDGEMVPETIDEIYNKIKFEKWLSVTVESLEYNDENKITAITMTINHNEE